MPVTEGGVVVALEALVPKITLGEPDENGKQAVTVQVCDMKGTPVSGVFHLFVRLKAHGYAYDDPVGDSFAGISEFALVAGHGAPPAYDKRQVEAFTDATGKWSVLATVTADMQLDVYVGLAGRTDPAVFPVTLNVAGGQSTTIDYFGIPFPDSTGPYPVSDGQTIVFDVNGDPWTHTLAGVTPGAATAQEIVDSINGDETNPGLVASLVDNKPKVRTPYVYGQTLVVTGGTAVGKAKLFWIGNTLVELFIDGQTGSPAVTQGVPFELFYVARVFDGAGDVVDDVSWELYDGEVELNAVGVFFEDVLDGDTHKGRLYSDAGPTGTGYFNFRMRVTEAAGDERVMLALPQLGIS